MSEEINQITRNRIGEPLEKELRKRMDFIQKQKEWRSAVEEFQTKLNMTKGQIMDFEKLQDIYLEYEVIYVDSVYQLGYSDGKLVGLEQKLEGKKTILSLEDMAILISSYTAVHSLFTVMNGVADMDETYKGIFGILKKLYDVIKNGVCQEIKLLGMEEEEKRIDSILGDIRTSTEDKAKMLLGIE